MRQTICGETPKKVNIYSNKIVTDFLEKEKNLYRSFSRKSFLYGKEKTIIDNSGLNYLNVLPENDVETSLKNIILSEFRECENAYPYLGDYFLDKLLGKNSRKSNKAFLFNRDKQKLFLSGIKSPDVVNIISWIFDNTSIKRNVNIVYHEKNDIFIEPINDVVFNFDYEFDFYVNNPGLIIENYRFIIVDGFLETMGEIHHLMTKANDTKEPYVIFCHGMSDEVKYNILRNNAAGRTQVLPVSINYDETTINILNDLAVIHGSSVVSSNLGQTISQESRKDLPVAKKITFFKNKIMIKSNVSEKTIADHRRFLKKRIDDAVSKGNVNTDPILNRMKNFSTKSLNIYLPEDLKRDNSTIRELDYCLRVIGMINLRMKSLNTKERENYFVPDFFIKKAESKAKNIKNMFTEIDKIIS